MSNTQCCTDQYDQELSLDDLSSLYGGGPVAMAGWVSLNLLSGGIPAFVDVAHAAPYTQEVMDSKYWIKMKFIQTFI